MYPACIRFSFFSVIVLLAISPLAAQTVQEPDIFESSYMLAPTVLPAELTGTQSQSAGAQQPESPVAEYRRALQDFKKQKHQYVHCKLKTGKILTGRIKGAGYEAFDIQTEAIGGIHYVYYADLAEVPRAVPAVGTRFKQGAEWTGVGALIAVGLPLAIIFSPFFNLIGWQC